MSAGCSSPMIWRREGATSAKRPSFALLLEEIIHGAVINIGMDVVVHDTVDEVEVDVVGLQLFQLTGKPYALVGISADVELRCYIQEIAGIVLQGFSEESFRVSTVIDPRRVVIIHAPAIARSIISLAFTRSIRPSSYGSRILPKPKRESFKSRNALFSISFILKCKTHYMNLPSAIYQVMLIPNERLALLLSGIISLVHLPKR